MFYIELRVSEKLFRVLQQVANKLFMRETHFQKYNVLILLHFTFRKQQAAEAAALFTGKKKKIICENSQSGRWRV